MKKFCYFILLSFIVSSCAEKEPCADCAECGLNLNVKEVSMDEALAKAKSGGTSGVDTTELQESIAKIEEKYGEQWDFCHCVVVNDSIDKAIKAGNTEDALIERWDYVDKKCQAFRIQDASRTPEQRELHEKKVRKCLKEAGIKN
jgi:hypothetical protein